MWRQLWSQGQYIGKTEEVSAHSMNFWVLWRRDTSSDVSEKCLCRALEVPRALSLPTQFSMPWTWMWHRTHCKGVLQYEQNTSAWIKSEEGWDIFIVMDVIQTINKEWLFIVFCEIRHRIRPEFFCVCSELLEAVVEIEYRKDRLNSS